MEDKFTQAEFMRLPRMNGRIVCLPQYFLQLTDKQVDMLHPDDWSYYQELQEELSMMIEEFA